MTAKERINNIFNHNTDLIGFWTGNPDPETVRLYLEQLGLKNRDEIFEYLNDDCRWIMADEAYKHPEGGPIFDVLGGEERRSLGQPGCFADCESLKEVEDYPWPDPDYLDYSGVIEKIERYPDKAIFSGLWSHFFHLVADFFGMENYFVKLYTDPAVVEAVTEHVVDFYVEGNRRFFEAAGDKVDVFFIGNDFGSQKDVLISPAIFKKFVYPGLKRIIGVAKEYNKKVMLHSCGSIGRIIPMLIDAGIDGLHPLQIKAEGMDVEEIAREYREDLVFVGGVDTQDLLVNYGPDTIKEEVFRLIDLLGPNYIVSASHEAILPNVPLENVVAMAEAVREYNQGR